VVGRPAHRAHVRDLRRRLAADRRCTVTDVERPDFDVDELRAESDARVAEQLAEWRRRDKLRREIRLQLAVARSAGLETRHASRLARGG
jgi:hypothetical protein